MTNEQSWKNCEYSIGDLAIDPFIPQIRLVKALIPETEEDKLLKREKINKFYYCKRPELIRVGAYRQEGLPNKEGGYLPIVQLFHLNLSDDIKGPWCSDVFGEERYVLEGIIEDGLAMCTHCKFYRRK